MLKQVVVEPAHGDTYGWTCASVNEWGAQRELGAVVICEVCMEAMDRGAPIIKVYEPDECPRCGAEFESGKCPNECKPAEDDCLHIVKGQDAATLEKLKEYYRKTGVSLTLETCEDVEREAVQEN